MTEDDTFLKLKRRPLEELEKEYDSDSAKRRELYTSGGFSDYLCKNGWTYSDYLKWKFAQR